MINRCARITTPHPGKELDPDVMERPPEIKRRVAGMKLRHPSNASVMLVEQKIDARVGHVGQIGHGPQLPEAVHEIAERRWRRGLGVDHRLDRFRNAILYWVVHAAERRRDASAAVRCQSSLRTDAPDVMY
jgi:hypothetical protein